MLSRLLISCALSSLLIAQVDAQSVTSDRPVKDWVTRPDGANQLRSKESPSTDLRKNQLRHSNVSKLLFNEKGQGSSASRAKLQSQNQTQGPGARSGKWLIQDNNRSSKRLPSRKRGYDHSQGNSIQQTNYVEPANQDLHDPFGGSDTLKHPFGEIPARRNVYQYAPGTNPFLQAGQRETQKLPDFQPPEIPSSQQSNSEPLSPPDFPQANSNLEPPSNESEQTKQTLPQPVTPDPLPNPMFRVSPNSDKGDEAFLSPPGEFQPTDQFSQPEPPSDSEGSEVKANDGSSIGQPFSTGEFDPVEVESQPTERVPNKSAETFTPGGLPPIVSPNRAKLILENAVQELNGKSLSEMERGSPPTAIGEPPVSSNPSAPVISARTRRQEETPTAQPPANLPDVVSPPSQQQQQQPEVPGAARSVVTQGKPDSPKNSSVPGQTTKPDPFQDPPNAQAVPIYDDPPKQDLAPLKRGRKVENSNPAFGMGPKPYQMRPSQQSMAPPVPIEMYGNSEPASDLMGASPSHSQGGYPPTYLPYESNSVHPGPNNPAMQMYQPYMAPQNILEAYDGILAQDGNGRGVGSDCNQCAPFQAAQCTEGIYYFSLFSGPASPSNFSSFDQVGNQVLFDLDTGYGLGFAAGQKQGRNLRTELELAFRNQAVDTMTFNQIGATSQLNLGGDLTTYSGMANVYWEFIKFPRCRVKPYVGAGIGFAVFDASIPLAPITSFDESSLAYQFMAGLNFKLGQNTDFFAEYRYFNADGVSIASDLTSLGGPASSVGKFDFSSQDVFFGLRFKF